MMRRIPCTLLINTERQAITIRKMSSVPDEVVLTELGNKCSILLNRPKALNSLNLPMIRKIHPALEKWEKEGKDLVLIEGAGEKAFCAGGDVRAVADSSQHRANNPLSRDFFSEEYKLNYRIATLKLPYIALVHGITMGGGVGLSIHGNFRVATEKTLFAMPETAIGLFPDVGGTYVLPRMEGSLGMYLALTGQRLKGYDVVHAGVATHFAPIEQVPKVRALIMDLGPKPKLEQIEGLLKSFGPEEVPEFSLLKHMEQINKHFSLSSVEQIIESLQKDGSPWASETTKILQKMSPASLKVTLEALTRGQNLSLEECFKMEFRLSQHCMVAHDFYEGVRALLIDKDQSPKWKPSSLADVSEQMVQSYFEPMEGVEDLVLS